MKTVMTGNGVKGGVGKNLLMPALRILRWDLRRAAAFFRYGGAALKSSPILFGNSFPKSGTHLLAQALSAFPKIGLAVDRGMGPILTFVRTDGRQRTSREILADLNRLRPGDLGFGHVIADTDILEQWRRSGLAHFFMIRDPRDVVVSHAFYLADKAVQNVHHAYFKSLPGLEERLTVSILGRPDWEGDFPNIYQRYEAYLGWLDCPDLCRLRFEDFITGRDASLEKMLDYAVERGFHISAPRSQALEILAGAIDPSRSFTFRAGRVGDWQKHFTAEHKRIFKEVAGDLLIRLGYEQDLEW